MRKAKDNSRVPIRYFRPDFHACPRCGALLTRRATVQDKVLTTWDGRFRLISRGYRCSRRRCPNVRARWVSPVPAQLRLRGSSFGFDVIVQSGWWRFWDHRTLDEIWALTRSRVPISRRQVMYLIVDFLCLLKAAHPARLAAHRPAFERQGLLLSLDAMQPEQGQDVLYVVRALRSGLTLQAAKVSNQHTETIRARVLAPIAALAFSMRGIVSDAEEALRRACQELWPGCPHHAGHFQALRDAGKPMYEADQHLMVTLKGELRAHLSPVRRALQALDEADPYRAVLQDYTEALRSSLRIRGVAPFRLGGVRLWEDLHAGSASLRRCQKKQGIPCWQRCWPPLWCTAPTLPPLSARAGTWGG